MSGYSFPGSWSEKLVHKKGGCCLLQPEAVPVHATGNQSPALQVRSAARQHGSNTNHSSWGLERSMNSWRFSCHLVAGGSCVGRSTCFHFSFQRARTQMSTARIPSNDYCGENGNVWLARLCTNVHWYCQYSENSPFWCFHEEHELLFMKNGVSHTHTHVCTHACTYTYSYLFLKTKDSSGTKV